MGELESTLKWFKKYKSPSTDCWTVDFYLTFHETIGPDPLKVVDECRPSVHMYEAINSTFIALITKSDFVTTSTRLLPRS